MASNKGPSFRAQLITRRTYNRPKDDGSFETWQETIDRVIGHQRWLWERAAGRKLNKSELQELETLRALMLDRKVLTSGRTLWLGGTDVAKTREASQFNCSFQRIETVYDVVDAFWLLLQGCGVGFEPVTGVLSGFTKPVNIEVVRSTRTTKGYARNDYQLAGDTFVLSVGDSAEAWAKSVGKLLALKTPIDTLILDFSEVRPAGERLSGYGWICSGDETFSKALTDIAKLLNARSGELLSRIDIIDILNHLGTALSSRRSAEIATVPADDPEAEAFASMKRDHWIDNPQRAQSNNSLVFYTKPTKMELKGLFALMLEAGGSEPGFINGEAARKRAAWFKGVNPCAEILLGNKSFCNLVEVDWGKFDPNDDDELIELGNAVWLAARANYRQTCVNLKDGVLSDQWHELNEFLRLCGVGATGVVTFLDNHKGNIDDLEVDLLYLANAARDGANSMADELGLPRAKAVTTIKPSGTLGKIMDTTEGAHKPLGRYIFNNVRFSKNDPLVSILKAANYYVFDDPYATDGVLVRLPVSYPEVEFEDFNGVPVNLEPAVKQLERYKLLMDYYVDHNCSITVSYDPSEVPAIVDWLYSNWDSYVGVSFLLRTDPTKTAQDLGYPYLPQEVVTKEVYEEYLLSLSPIDLDAQDKGSELVGGDDCATGACPIR